MQHPLLPRMRTVSVFVSAITESLSIPVTVQSGAQSFFITTTKFISTNNSFFSTSSLFIKGGF